MRFLRALTGLIALSFLAACGQQSTSTNTLVPDVASHHDAADLAGKAASGLYMNGTLATLGSFEWDAAPITNKAADILVAIPLALKKGEMSKQVAQTRLDAADKAHDLAQQALKACKQDSKTGKCKGNEVKARALLDQAKAQLAGL